MNDTYRVMVIRETEDEDGEMNSTRLIELAAPREMLAQFAPQAVAAALGTTAQEATPPKMAMEGPAETPEQKTERRKRRTKAEMEAARNGETTVQTSEVGGGPAPETPTVITTFESAKPIPVETPTSGSGYRPFG